LKAQPGSRIYCLDASALIDIQWHYPKAIRKVSRCARDGKIVIPEGVYRELCKKSDRLQTTVQTWEKKHNAVVHLNTERLHTEFARIEKAYGHQIVVGSKVKKGFWTSKSGKVSADGQVVTVCKVLHYIAVSNDEHVQDACHLEDVPCIGWQEFYRRMGRGFGDQASLFDEELSV